MDCFAALLLAMTEKNAPVSLGVSRAGLRFDHHHSLCPAAARIRSAISLGCDTSDKWPASSSTVVAFMRLARNRSRSGLMVWSCLDTAYQDGLERHAATVVRPAKIEAAVGHCTA